MKGIKGAAATALLSLAVAAQPGWAASRCASDTSAEAEQAIRYMTDLMVASSACKNTVYAEFALRNREAIIHYQNAMIAHLRGKAAFDRWDTALANEISQIEAGLPAAQFCQQKAPLMQQAAALDTKGFKAVAATQAVAAKPAGCRK